MQSQPYRLLDESEYLTLEARSPVRHEYVAGEIFAMTGASIRHNIIAGNLYTALRTHLRGSPCRALMEGVKLYLKKERSYFYPDVMATCEPGLSSAGYEPSLMVPPRSPPPSTMPTCSAMVAITGSGVAGSSSLELASGSPASERAASITMHCMPRHRPRAGMPCSRA